MSSRRGSAAALVLLPAALLLACERVPEPRPATRPNVLFVSIDSLRADHLGAYGYARDTSPNLDRLAAEGVLFEEAIAESSWTLPSHVSMFTGVSQGVHGVDRDTQRLGVGFRTLAESFREAGYSTRAWVSGPYLHPIFGFDRGFDGYEVIGSTIYDHPDYQPGRARWDAAWKRELRAHERAAHRTRTSDDLAERVEAFLASHDHSPFFLFVHMFDPHYDYAPPEPYWRRFDPDYEGTFDASSYVRDPRIRADMPRALKQHVIARYDGETRWTDEHLGRMVAALEAHGLADDTLVLVTGDHGEEFFEHGDKGHRKTLFDEQLLVPLVMRWPRGLPAGRRVPGQTRLIDLRPTLLELAGIESETPVLGESLVPRIEGRGGPPAPALALLRRPGRLLLAFRTGEGKLLVERTERGGESARWFDLESDPGEQRPVAAGAPLVAARERPLEGIRGGAARPAPGRRGGARRALAGDAAGPRGAWLRRGGGTPRGRGRSRALSPYSPGPCRRPRSFPAPWPSPAPARACSSPFRPWTRSAPSPR